MPTDQLALSDIRAALSQQGDTWEAGVTSMWTLPQERRRMRLRPGMLAAEETPPAPSPATTAPPAFDLRDAGGASYVTPIRDQMQCGGSVVFAAVAAVESGLRLQRGDPGLAIDLSEAHLQFLHANGGDPCLGAGPFPAQVFDLLRDKGVVDEACFPYAAAHAGSAKLCPDAASRLTRITGYTPVTGNPAAVKTWIATKGPVLAEFEVYEDLFAYHRGVYRHVAGRLAGATAVAIVGYDDAGGHWICKNSWGSGWGEEGFLRIAYGQCRILDGGAFGVNGIAETGWHRQVRVLALHATDQERTGSAKFESLGWRRISSQTDAIFYAMLAELICAKAASLPVDFYEQDSVITQLAM